MKPTKPNPISTFFSLRYSSQIRKLLHPPLPLMPKDEQRLLEMLKKSFRKRLDASPVDSGSGSGLDSSLSQDTESKFRSPAEDHFKELLKAPLFKTPVNTSCGSDTQERLQEFMKNPLDVFEERALHGIPSPNFAVSALKRQTQNMVKVPEGEKDPDWAAKSIIRILTVYQHDRPRIHFTNDPLRRQVIQTLIQAHKSHIAAGMVTKEWLLKVEPGEPGSDKKLQLRHQLVNDLVDVMQEIEGYDAAAAFFLEMVTLWKQDGGYMPENLDFHKNSIRMRRPSALSMLQKSRIPLNPFQTKAQHFLFHYAQMSSNELTPDMTGIRKQIYETCLPWVRNGMVRSRLILHYTGNPYPIYRYLTKQVNRDHGQYYKRKSETWTLLYAHGCLEATLALVERSDWAKATVIVQHMHEVLEGRIAGVDAAMFDEIKEMLHSPRLLDVLVHWSRRLRELLGGFEKTYIGNFWSEGTEAEPLRPNT